MANLKIGDLIEVYNGYDNFVIDYRGIHKDCVVGIQLFSYLHVFPTGIKLNTLIVNTKEASMYDKARKILYSKDLTNEQKKYEFTVNRISRCYGALVLRPIALIEDLTDPIAVELCTKYKLIIE
jgi:hypothetical protein